MAIYKIFWFKSNKEGRGASLVQHEHKKKLSQMQCRIHEIHMQSLVVAVEGSVKVLRYNSFFLK